MAEYERTKDEWVLSSGDPEIHYGYTCNMAVRRETFETLGPFERLPRGADTLFVRRVVKCLRRDQRHARVRVVQVARQDRCGVVLAVEL